MNALEKLARIAESQIGTREEGENMGPEILKYQVATWLLGQGWPWCAAFVCWCIKKLSESNEETFGLLASELPKTPRAFDFEPWGRRIGAMVWKDGGEDRKFDPQRGDIVIYDFSHIGIVTRGLNSEGLFDAVEGNTNQAGSREGEVVARKTRSMKSVRCLVRIPLRAIPI